MHHYKYSVRVILAFTDYIIINCGLMLSVTLLRFTGEPMVHDLYRRNLVIINLLWFICSNITTAVAQKKNKDAALQDNSWKTVMIHLIFLSACLYYSDELNGLKNLMVDLYIILIVLFLMRKVLFNIAWSFMKRRADFRKQVALMGGGPSAMALAAHFKNDHNHYTFAGFLNDNESVVNDNHAEYRVGIKQQIKKAAETGINELYVALNPGFQKNIDLIHAEAENNGIRLKFIPDLHSTIGDQCTVDIIGNSPVITLKSEPIEELHNRFIKRLADIVFSFLVIVFVLSWLYPILAIIIKFQSKGPVLFKQLRNGRDNSEFWCYKFRSMKMNDESDTKQVTRNDDRITAIGRFMRKTSIDELPQFINVFIGDMSVVGPRPHMLKHTEHYRRIIDKYMIRHYLKPGITGWAQINGFRGETNEVGLMEKRIEYDIWYLENWTSWLDLKIVYFTVVNALRGEKNAY